MAEEFGNEKAPKGAHGSGEDGHVSVLLKEAIDFLAIRRGGTYIDATLGLGGHSLEIAKRLGPQGHLIGFDKDTNAIELARQRLSRVGGDNHPKITLLHSSYAEIPQHVPPASVDGLLADLGVSSLQFGDAARGFSFQAEGPLDMRMDPQGERTADQVVNHMREEDLANVIYEFGEERRSRRIARAIVRARPIRSTAHLAQVISAALRSMNNDPTTGKDGPRRGPRTGAHQRIHPATTTFQAIRIFVNRELEDLQALMDAAPDVLKKGGRLVVISFHSLEDRIVKDALRDGAKAGIFEVLTKKPLTATQEEIDRNPRSRSAKLRAAERL
ncbi:MAG TPA: 16S rRNA (cytosine(1402)-N(4))-methyltransferase RsmH [Candidatus Acidoferrales bacterium]|nr:16S rRNA (cytosine(1402)-N(4))-methyltransferase RsmH [Candidatus Acidoferrales bacterium]